MGNSHKGRLNWALSDRIIIHPPSGWFFIFGHSPCLLAAPEGASTVWHVRGAFYFTFVQSPLPVTCLRLFYLFLLFLRFLCYSFLAYQTYFLFGRPPFDVLDAVARPHPYSTSKGVFLSCPTAISASEPPAPSAGFSLYKKQGCDSFRIPVPHFACLMDRLIRFFFSSTSRTTTSTTSPTERT